MLTTMKTKKYILFALAVLGLTTSCMEGSWDAPSAEEGMSAYGNQNIAATNVKTIAELKAQFATEINGNSLKQVTQPMQIIGVVTGNDAGGNIYNSLYLQDNTGAIAISIGQGGLYGPFSVGQTVLVELNGLYVGGYGNQPQIGTTYTNPNKEGATPQVGRMTRYTWQEHYKLLSPIEGLEVNPLENKWSLINLGMAANCGRLITLKGVEIKDADGTAVYAPSSGIDLTANCANRPIKGFSNIVLRTSTYADFANTVMPTGKVDITGIATRYENTWQILMRTEKDIQPSTLDANDYPEVVLPTGNGSRNNPYNVTGLFEATKDLANKATSSEYYVKGYVTKLYQYSSQYGSINYAISDDLEGNCNAFYVYSGLGLNKQKFSSPNDLKVGDEVIICGKVQNYNYIWEFDKQNYLVKLNNGGDVTPDTPGESNVTRTVDDATLTLTNTAVTASANTIAVDLSAQGWSNAEEVTSLTASDGTTITFSVGEGGTTPKYYDATKGIRMYAKNAITVTGASKAIAKVVLECDSYNGTDYIGNPTLYGSATGNSMTIVNEHSSASGGVQLRVKTITITYAN